MHGLMSYRRFGRARSLRSDRTLVRARSLRNDRASARAQSLRSDRAEHVFGCCVATLFELLSDDSCFFRKAFRKEESISKKYLSKKVSTFSSSEILTLTSLQPFSTPTEVSHSFIPSTPFFFHCCSCVFSPLQSFFKTLQVELMYPKSGPASVCSVVDRCSMMNVGMLLVDGQCNSESPPIPLA
ncbi:hypothetical protein F2Q70_00038883 [Brassica cretica]|uniref:Uncharacterized protein n=1 Tax=Brassica cretica TaxID=69181 RepID=A0A8S9K0G0_BRACR|nr:hypothetical protein F2Q70_00038883 [Brassica cretica]KAF2616727.1 hypothetical protein F2Q68_00039568 [Brassica cretica]